jgi:ribonuclease HII
MKEDKNSLRALSIGKIKELLSINASPDILEMLDEDPRKSVKSIISRYRNQQGKAAILAKKTAVLYEPLASALSNGFNLVGGIDEAGRGPLAGPVVAACAIIPIEPRINVDDSKKLTEAKRDSLYKTITEQAISFGIGIVSAHEIDSLNIYRSTQKAMFLAFENCSPEKPDFCFIDAMKVKEINVPQKSLIKGDAICAPISAASIIAKVTRDRIMKEAALLYPQYGFESHKGYGSAAHMEALAKYGPCPIHRTSFSPVSDYVLPTKAWFETMLRRCSSIDALKNVGINISKSSVDLTRSEILELRETYTECFSELTGGIRFGK